MGGLFCKQRSRSRPQHSAQSRRKKLHRVHCLLRGPCLLCFIVHGEHPTSEAASPDLPATQDCARLLLLCPGELSTWQERHLCGGLLKGPGLLCTATSQQPADDMLCKRKNCGENQQSLTPCKQPRCTPTREQAHPHGEEDLSSCSGGDTVHPHGEDLSPHPHAEDLSSCSGGDTVHPHGEDLSVHPQAEDLSPHPHAEDLSSCSGGGTVHPHAEDLSAHPHAEDLSAHPHAEDLSAHPHAEDLSAHPHAEDLSSCSGRETAPPQTEDLSPHPRTGDPSPCPGGQTKHPQARELSSSPRGQTVHPNPEDLSSCHSERTGHPMARDMAHSSGSLTPPYVEVLAPSCSAHKVHCQGKWQLTGNPSLACTEQRAHSLPGNMSHHSIEEQPPSSGDLTTTCVEDQEPHCSGLKTLQCLDSLFSHTGGYAQQFSRDPATLCTQLQLKPANGEPLRLGTEDHGQTSENSCCSNKLSGCCTMCQDRIPSSLTTFSHVDLPSSGCNQTAISQSPKVEGEVLVPCEPLNINQLPPSLLLKIFSLLSLNERCLSASLVCKYWRDLCLDFQFWKQLDLSSRQQVRDSLLEKIASRCWNITEINISDCLNVSDAGISKLAMNCSGLMKYTAYRCKQLSDPSLISLATHCPSLQKVHVGNQDRLTDNALKQLGSRCKDLRDIHFGQCYKISDEGMVVMAKGCPKLQKIYMQENKLVTNRSVEAFAEHCPELQYVGFMGCSVTSHGVIHLTSLKNLSSLDLRNITELDNQTVEEIVKRCQNLISLNLCLNRNINDRCVEVIAKEGRSLRELYLVTCKITDYALIAIGRYSSTIETVDVGWCKEITDQGATLIAQSSKSIRYLGLMRCDQVNESTVEQLVQQYPHITFSTVLQDCKRTLERAYQMGWTPNASSVS